MKYIFLSVCTITLFIACNNNNSDDDATKLSKDKKITTRDRSITRSNAYNDIFLDSNAMEKFIAGKKLDDTLARRIRSFYNARNYQFAWFSSDGLTEQARGFWNIHDYYTTYVKDSSLNDKALQKKMDRLIAEEDLSVNPSDQGMINTEFLLTQHFIQYTLNAYEDGYVKRKEMERFIPVRKEDALKLADSLLSKKHKDNKYYEDVNPSFKALKDQLKNYVEIAKKGGWPQVNVEVKQLKKGKSSAVIPVIKKRLQVTGDMTGADSSQVFDDQLEAGVKQFQLRHGYTADGIITAALIKDMNVTVNDRIRQLLINMGRMQWMVSQPAGKMITVNIPEFVLHVRDGDKKVFDMNVVVGKEGHNTMMFTGDLSQVVFNPYWNVPPSIVRKEILPAIEKDKHYLEKENMEIIGDADGIPDIRQKPGEKNALGKVKFLFPNSFNIYFHDTPSKSLFNKDKRAYSHGCIRLSDPVKMANYVLQDDPYWTPEKIDEAMNKGTEKFVKVRSPIPVLITYYTAWVDENGLLHFAEDIYGHDELMAKKMFTDTL